LLERWRGRVLVGYAAALACFVAAYLDREPYDDSYFFKRIALNALDRGSLAWNVDEGPVYGSTSQTMQLLAVLVAAVSRDHYMLLTRIISVLALVGAFALLLRLTQSLDDGLSALLAFSAPALLFSALSGMETALALLAICAFLWCLYSVRGRALPWAIAPLLLLLIYLTRPDAALLALGPLLAERHLRQERWPIRELALIGLGLVALLVCFRAYYGTALPLPFYAKQTAFSPYDAHFIHMSRQDGWRRFGVFAIGAVPLACGGLLRRDRTNLVLLASAGAFVLYHLIFTIDVMGMHGRFYAPAAPLLALACARAAEHGRETITAPEKADDPALAVSAPRWALAILLVAGFGVLLALRALPIHAGFALDNVPLAFFTLTALGGAAQMLIVDRSQLRRLAVACVLLVLLVASAARIRSERLHAYSDEQYLSLHTSRYTVYRGLDTLRACFGESLHVYHSEMGVPGLRFQAGKVTDLAGLLSPAWLFGKADIESACRSDAPAAIFLPHKNYVELNRRITESHCLAGYQRVVEESSSPLYVRRDLAPRFLECAAERADPFVSVNIDVARHRRRHPK